jgi:hypothetical protein
MCSEYGNPKAAAKRYQSGKRGAFLYEKSPEVGKRGRKRLKSYKTGEGGWGFSLNSR